MTAAFMLSLAVPAVFAAEETTDKFETGLIPSPHVFLPSGKVKAAIVLFSDSSGWSDADKKQASDLVDQGAVVIGIDLAQYFEQMRKYDLSENDGCIYLVSDIEALSQQVQRAAGDNVSYQLPIIAGIGDGGSLALTIAAQTPDATIATTLAVDPTSGIPVTQQFCTPASKMTVGDRMVYGLSDGQLPDDIITVFTPSASKDGRSHVEELKKDHPDIDVRESSSDPRAALAEQLSSLIEDLGNADNALGLPLTILDAKPKYDTLAIIYSGDGGWRDIDKEVGAALQKDGIPVIGVDSLHYFWSERKPQETADDLGRIIELYRKQFKVRHVLLIGYSFGADILPAAYSRLKPSSQGAVTQISLLGLSREVDYQISVMGWLGQKTSGKGGDTTEDLKKVDPKLVQCIYGTDDDDEIVCPEVKASGVQVIPLPGDHHFDENYELLAQKIINGLKARLQD